jgi:hypothetical protein
VSKSEFKGWAVFYPNAPGYKGTDAYLQLEGAAACHTYNLESATLFKTEDEARRRAQDFAHLLGTGHLPPAPAQIWEDARLVLRSGRPVTGEFSERDVHSTLEKWRPQRGP